MPRRKYNSRHGVGEFVAGRRILQVSQLATARLSGAGTRTASRLATLAKLGRMGLTPARVLLGRQRNRRLPTGRSEHAGQNSGRRIGASPGPAGVAEFKGLAESRAFKARAALYAWKTAANTAWPAKEIQRIAFTTRRLTNKGFVVRRSASGNEASSAPSVASRVPESLRSRLDGRATFYNAVQRLAPHTRLSMLRDVHSLAQPHRLRGQDNDPRKSTTYEILSSAATYVIADAFGLACSRLIVGTRDPNARKLRDALARGISARFGASAPSRGPSSPGFAVTHEALTNIDQVRNPRSLRQAYSRRTLFLAATAGKRAAESVNGSLPYSHLATPVPTSAARSAGLGSLLKQSSATVNYAPTVVINAASPKDIEQIVVSALSRHGHELARILAGEAGKRDRTAL